jgi:hypothetical protein
MKKIILGVSLFLLGLLAQVVSFSLIAPILLSTGIILLANNLSEKLSNKKIFKISFSIIILIFIAQVINPLFLSGFGLFYFWSAFLQLKLIGVLFFAVASVNLLKEKCASLENHSINLKWFTFLKAFVVAAAVFAFYWWFSLSGLIELESDTFFWFFIPHLLTWIVPVLILFFALRRKKILGLYRELGGKFKFKIRVLLLIAPVVYAAYLITISLGILGIYALLFIPISYYAYKLYFYIYLWLWEREVSSNSILTGK